MLPLESIILFTSGAEGNKNIILRFSTQYFEEMWYIASAHKFCWIINKKTKWCKELLQRSEGNEDLIIVSPRKNKKNSRGEKGGRNTAEEFHC